MRKLLERLIAYAKFRLGALSLATLQHISSLPLAAKKLDALKEIYLILSIDAESDIYTYKTSRAGWQIGVPYILDMLSDHGLNGKACWLIEFNIRDGLVFSNPSSGSRFVVEHENLVEEIKKKNHEFGLHPTVYDYVQDQWHYQRPLRDPDFVYDLIHQGTKTLLSVCKQKPVGCRTSNFHFAHSLARALEIEGYLLDSSSKKQIIESVTAPNAWFAGQSNYLLPNTMEPKTKILEIPTTDYLRAGWNGAFSLRYKPNMVKIDTSDILFLSAFFHNWDAVTKKGKPNPTFRDGFGNFINSAVDANVKVVSFTDAYEIFKSRERQLP